MKKSPRLSLVEPYVFKKIKLPQHVSYNNSFWLKRKRYFFKYFRDYSSNASQILGEVLVSRLCKLLGVNCIQCGYAINSSLGRTQRGVLSTSFLRPGEKSITLASIRENEILKDWPKGIYKKLFMMYVRISPLTTLRKGTSLNQILHTLAYKYVHDTKVLLPSEKRFIENNLDLIRESTKKIREEVLSLDECERRIKSFAQDNGYTLTGDVRLELQKMAIIDAITKQADRHAGNVSLIYDPKQKTARLAPMYDNSMCEIFFAGDIQKLKENMNMYSFLPSDNVDTSYPQYVNCYLQLTEHDYEQIRDSNTDISKFFDGVVDFFNNGIDTLLGDMRAELTDAKYKKDLFLFDVFSGPEYWDMVKSNYLEGIRYLSGKMNHLVPIEGKIL